MSVSAEVARQTLAAQPFNAQVGARIAEFGDGTAVIEVDVEDRHRQQYGIVHGGVLSYVADNALTFAAGSVLGPSVITAGMAISYLASTRDGTLRATATVAHHTPRQAEVRVDVEAIARDGARTLCAIAQGTVLTSER